MILPRSFQIQSHSDPYSLQLAHSTEILYSLYGGGAVFWADTTLKLHIRTRTLKTKTIKQIHPITSNYRQLLKSAKKLYQEA